MAGENELVTVFRSGDAEAEEQAGAVRDMLAGAHMDALVFDDSAAGVPEGVYEVRVPAAQAAEAEEFIATRKDSVLGGPDVSEDLDMVPVFVSDASDAEMLATQIRSILEANEIPSVLVNSSAFPSLPYEIRVPRERLDEARQVIAAAEAAGPAAAEEAERATEEEPGASVDLP